MSRRCSTTMVQGPEMTSEDGNDPIHMSADLVDKLYLCTRQRVSRPPPPLWLCDGERVRIGSDEFHTRRDWLLMSAIGDAGIGVP